MIRSDLLGVAFASSPVPQWVFDRETCCMLAVNDAALAEYGYTLTEFLALTASPLHPAGRQHADHAGGDGVGATLLNRCHTLVTPRGDRVVRLATVDLLINGRPVCLVQALDAAVRGEFEAVAERWATAQ